MKLKPDAKALLTLGPGMCRDKLMQAAMRMRQLEQRQSLTLVASFEVCRCAAALPELPAPGHICEACPIFPHCCCFLEYVC